METAHLEHKQIPKITHLKELAVGDNGETFGDNMVARPQRGQKPLDQVGIHDNFVRTVFRQDSRQKMDIFP